MILTVDIGGTKTRLATVTRNMEIDHEVQFPTPKDTAELVQLISDSTKTDFPGASVISIGAPGLIADGVIRGFGKLKWKNFPLVDMLKQQLPGIEIYLENDANLGGLGAYALHGDTKPVGRCMYLTLSTGVGAGFIIDGKISTDLNHAEVGFMSLRQDGTMSVWEDMVSGRAFVKETGLYGADVNDPAIWQQYAKDVAIGLAVIMPIFQPELILIGGGLGAHFKKYEVYLRKYISELVYKSFNNCEIEAAAHPEYVVNIGAYIYAKQKTSG